MGWGVSALARVEVAHVISHTHCACSCDCLTLLCGPCLTIKHIRYKHTRSSAASAHARCLLCHKPALLLRGCGRCALRRGRLQPAGRWGRSTCWHSIAICQRLFSVRWVAGRAFGEGWGGSGGSEGEPQPLFTSHWAAAVAMLGQAMHATPTQQRHAVSATA